MQGVGGGARAEVAQKAEDEARADTPGALGFVERACDAVDDGVERHASGEVALRVEEHLRVAHAVRVRPLQIGGREVVEVALGAQHRDARVVDPQKV